MIDKINQRQTEVTRKRIVLAGGCFDFIHYGHVHFLTNAKKAGDYLIVALESDENVRRMKGEHRPIHTQSERKEMLEALRVIDEVIALPPMNGDGPYGRLVTDIHPAVVAVTEGDPILEKKRAHAEAIGAEVLVIPKISTPSTSQLAKLLDLE